MARRLYKTTADYLAIAVTPALIMALVTSLVFFLLLVFYRGEWQGRLQYILFLFVFAAVLIARIAIEEGRERAMLFSVFLGGATAFVVSRFSDLSMAVNLALLGLIWWCADRLTWDCTLIDEHENSSGEGLLQTVGLDAPSAEPQAARAADVELLGVTSREHSVEEKTWWRRAWEHFHKPRSPGVWVVYFSMAALPIFGFGQKFISGTAERESAFRYLFIYVASALGLLLATCFLGLRRYLRQRQVEMPDKMAAVWVATGCALIGALLILCTVLPRRNPVLEIAENAPPIRFGSPGDLKPSWLGWGDEGIENDRQSGSARKVAQTKSDGESQGRQHSNPSGRNGEPQGTGQSKGGQSPRQAQSSGKSDSSPNGPSSEGEQQQSDSSGSRQPSGQNGQSSPGDQSQSQAGKQGSQGSDSQAGGSQQSQSQGNQGQKKQGGQQTDQNGQQPGQNSQRQSGGQRQGESAQQQERQPAETGSSRETSSARQTPEGSSSEQTQQPRERPEDPSPQTSPSRQAGQDQSSQSRPQQPFNPGAIFSSLFGWLGTLLRLGFYAVLVLAGVWFFRKYKDDLLAGFRELFNDLRKLWEQLLGKKSAAAPELEAPIETGPAYRPFSDYPDPFASAVAGRYTPEQLVKYSFEAFEAWARERGCPRHPEQTPHEFAQAIGAKNAAVSRPARALAELYSRLAYAPGPLPASSVDHVKQLWAALRSGG
jgi:hypothetical protein